MIGAPLGSNMPVDGTPVQSLLTSSLAQNNEGSVTFSPAINTFYIIPIVDFGTPGNPNSYATVNWKGQTAQILTVQDGDLPLVYERGRGPLVVKLTEESVTTLSVLNALTITQQYAVIGWNS